MKFSSINFVYQFANILQLYAEFPSLPRYRGDNSIDIYGLLFITHSKSKIESRRIKRIRDNNKNDKSESSCIRGQFIWDSLINMSRMTIENYSIVQ